MNEKALSAVVADKVSKVNFISEAHEEFYFEKLNEMRYQDVYHKALVYCIGMYAVV